jgi:hypothetical protein
MVSIGPDCWRRSGMDGAMTRQEAGANVAVNAGSIGAVKRFLAWVAGAAGGLAAYRVVRRKHPGPSPNVEADDRAAELKVRLQQAREATDDREAFESGEVPVDAAEPLDPAARRAAVHEQGRAALDEMRGDPGP